MNFLRMLYHAANEPYILQEVEKRKNRILDADYSNVEVYPYVQELSHLTEDEKNYWVRHSRSSHHCLEVDWEC
jgi:hypothetical protein